MPKQIRLSTILLVTTVFALLLALYSQQKRHNAELANARENGWLAGKFYADDMLVNRVLMYKPERFDAWSRTMVVTFIRNLWRNERQNEGFRKRYPSPTTIEMAKHALFCAKIESHQELVDYAMEQTFYNPNNGDDATYLDAEGISANLPELQDSNSAEYSSFRSFVERALD